MAHVSSDGDKEADCPSSEAIDPAHGEYFRTNRSKLAFRLLRIFGKSLAEDVDDVIQQAWCSAMQSHKQFSEIKFPNTYFSLVTERAAKNHLKEKAERKETILIVDRINEEDSSDILKPEEIFTIAEKILSKEEMIFIRLRFGDKRQSLKQIAVIMGYTDTAMRKHSSRVIEKLRNACDKAREGIERKSM